MLKLSLLKHDLKTKNVTRGLFLPCFQRFKQLVMERNLLFLSKGVIELNLLPPEEMQRINNIFRGKNYATDVLTFPYPDAVDNLKGELFVCPDVAAQQAAVNGNNLQQELRVLFVHGLLHLAGYEHENDAEEAEMEAAAKWILAEGG